MKSRFCRWGGVPALAIIAWMTTATSTALAADGAPPAYFKYVFSGFNGSDFHLFLDGAAQAGSGTASYCVWTQGSAGWTCHWYLASLSVTPADAAENAKNDPYVYFTPSFGDAATVRWKFERHASYCGLHEVCRDTRGGWKHVAWCWVGFPQ
jgi:hypothetical protein